MNLDLIRKRIIALRKLKHLTQHEIAEKLGINRSTYAHYEVDDNQRVPENINLIIMANFHNVTTDYLLGRDHQLSIIELTEDGIRELFELKVDGIELEKEELDLLTTLIRVQRMQKKSQ